MNRAADSPVLAPDNMFSDRAPGRVGSGQCLLSVGLTFSHTKAFLQLEMHPNRMSTLEFRYDAVPAPLQRTPL